MHRRQRNLLNGKLKMENGKLNTLKIFNFQLSIFNSRVAFTLAEVLITLAVIGVVAAVTMPALIQNYKKHVYVNQLKQSISILSQLTHKIMTDDEVDNFSNTKFFNDAKSAGCVEVTDNYDWGSDKCYGLYKNEFSKYIKVLDVYTCKAYDTKCGVKSLNRTDTIYQAENDKFMTLANGIAIDLKLNYFNYSANTSKYPNERCGWSTLDLNGISKKPNQYGRDQFIFWLGCDGNWYPQYGVVWNRWTFGDDNDRETWQDCSTDTNSYGQGCAARIMAEGYKMNY